MSMIHKSNLFSKAVCLMVINIVRISAEGYSLSYEDARKAVIQAEDLFTTGGRIQLNAKEMKVDDIFMKYKLDELSAGFRNAEVNAAAMHFFKAKPLIECSKVFRFLKQMPKGAVLHTHTTASVSSEWMVRNISYMPGLLRCTNKDNVSILTFRQTPIEHGCVTRYVRVADERLRSISRAAYDRSFEKLINLYTPVPEFEYPSSNVAWKKFQSMFTTVNDVIRYLPAYRAYHWQMLEEMYNDNIMYAEVRGDFKELYDASGRTFPQQRAAKELLNIVEQFRAQHPNFLGIKFIYATQRSVDRYKVQKQFEIFKQFHRAYPNFVIGFDLVGEEDKGKPLYTFLNELTDLPKKAHYFFHAGETNWYGASTDFNLLDAILLNTTRIGHGFALMKHPILWNTVKTRGIAVEVSPISNQMTHLVEDLRNHPGAFFISQNIPMVICNDDPGFWNAKGLSYDFYYAIMSFAPNHAGLKTLKNLVWSSIRYSMLNDWERKRAFTTLERAWDHFLDDILEGRL